MYQFSYAEIQTDSVADAKDRERQLLSRSIDLLVAAREKGANSMQAIEALHFLNRVWTTFIEDLASGLWLLREGEAVRQGQSDNFDGLIEVSQIIRDGIQ